MNKKGDFGVIGIIVIIILIIALFTLKVPFSSQRSDVNTLFCQDGKLMKRGGMLGLNDMLTNLGTSTEAMWCSLDIRDEDLTAEVKYRCVDGEVVAVCQAQLYKVILAGKLGNIFSNIDFGTPIKTSTKDSSQNSKKEYDLPLNYSEITSKRNLKFEELRKNWSSKKGVEFCEENLAGNRISAGGGIPNYDFVSCWINNEETARYLDIFSGEEVGEDEVHTRKTLWDEYRTNPHKQKNYFLESIQGDKANYVFIFSLLFAIFLLHTRRLKKFFGHKKLFKHIRRIIIYSCVFTLAYLFFNFILGFTTILNEYVIFIIGGFCLEFSSGVIKIFLYNKSKIDFDKDFLLWIFIHSILLFLVINFVNWINITNQYLSNFSIGFFIALISEIIVILIYKYYQSRRYHERRGKN